MDPFERFIALANFIDSYCDLHHTQYKPPTINQIIQVLDTGDKLSINICEECLEALQGDEWVLLYCVNCLESRWVWKEASKMSYQHNILWLNGCPECTNEFGGLYFTDVKE